MISSNKEENTTYCTFADVGRKGFHVGAAKQLAGMINGSGGKPELAQLVEAES